MAGENNDANLTPNDIASSGLKLFSSFISFDFSTAGIADRLNEAKRELRQ